MSFNTFSYLKQWNDVEHDKIAHEDEPVFITVESNHTLHTMPYMYALFCHDN